ncbi:MAG: hypothetical protein G3M70_04060 [Candidatus Nitronauta litoralis]|uniref:SMP-30/Gluconolactonase/LRE-like region domain-containing protein n=1 Tax=Candidatus Nitronauta litoralis TaxID=2705533 RepID=A0A7T0BUC8_9BACT|nr:MAG: hypothetical protein G3M70_04060 [Candidatus Nitronauta litoralis]
MNFKFQASVPVLLIFALLLSGFTMTGFKSPDSVLVDPETSRLYVSNVNGSPALSDGNGFISLLDPSGKPVNMHFIRSGRGGVNLNAPKGMALIGQDLYVTDLQQVHRFDKNKATLKGTIDLKLLGAKNLTGLAVGPDGVLFVSDPATSTIFKIDTVHQHRAAVHVRDQALGQPTSLLYDAAHHRLLAGCWGSGQLLFIGEDGKIFSLMQKRFKRIKSLHFDREGHLLFAALVTGKIYRLRNYEKLEVVRENLVTPANFALDKDGRRLVVPSYRGNIVFSFGLPY